MIYFIQEESENIGNIKIGYTDNDNTLHQRIKHHQCGNPRNLQLIGATEGNIDTENQFHSMFSNINIRGEWYKPNINLLLFILGSCDWCESEELFRQIKVLRSAENGVQLTQSPRQVNICNIHDMHYLGACPMCDTPSK